MVAPTNVPGDEPPLTRPTFITTCVQVKVRSDSTYEWTKEWGQVNQGDATRTAQRRGNASKRVW